MDTRNPFGAHHAARQAARGMGSPDVVQARAALIFREKSVPPKRVVSTLADVTDGMRLPDHVADRVQRLVDDKSVHRDQFGQGRAALTSAVLLRELREVGEVPTEARREIVSRALAYWQRPEPIAKALYIGPKGGKWADPEHTIAWRPEDGDQASFAFPKACSQCKGKGTVTLEQPDMFGGESKRIQSKCRRCKGAGVEPSAKKSGDVCVTDDPAEVLRDWQWTALSKGGSMEAQLEELVKAKYIRRIATGNPERPWRYIYHRQEKSRWQRAAWDQVKSALKRDQEDHGKPMSDRSGARAVHYGENVAALNPQVLKLALDHLKATHGPKAVAQLQAIVDHATGAKRHPDAPKPKEEAKPEPVAEKPAPKPVPLRAPPPPSSQPSANPDAARRGAQTVVFVAGDGGQPVAMRARYRLVEADDVKASHNPQTFSKNKEYPTDVQERAYHRDKSEQAKVIRNAQQIRPEFVVNTNPDAVNGPPIITPEGVVLGGNSRTMSMQLAYSDHPEKAAELKSYLAEHAHTVGLDRQAVEGMKNPILVREVTPPDETMDTKRLLVRQMNESFTQGMDPRTMQVALGRRISEGTLSNLAEGMEADETLNHFLSSPRSEAFINGLRRDGVIDRRNANQYMRRNAAGRLNEDGKTLVERILVGRVVNDADILSNTSPRTIESIARSVPHMIQAKAYGEGYDISDDMKVAVDALNDLQSKVENNLIPALDAKMPEREMKGLMEHFRLLPGMGDEHEITKNETARDLLEVLIRRPGAQQMSTVFREYARRAAEAPEGQSSLFGPGPTPREVLSDAINATVRKSGWGGGLVFQASPRVAAQARLLAQLAGGAWHA